MPANFEDPDWPGPDGFTEGGPPHTAGGPAPPASFQGSVPAPPPGRPPRLTAEEVAAQLAETGAAAFMYLSMERLFVEADAASFKCYRDRLVAGCGAPSDPVELMLIEQLALAHLTVGRLHSRSARAQGVEEARAYGSLAVNMVGEFRRLALGLKAYRAGSRAARGGKGLPAPAVAAKKNEGEVEGAEHTEQGSEPGGQDDGGATIPMPEPAAGGGGPKEPAKKNRAH
jgi:hypothetical protein